MATVIDNQILRGLMCVQELGDRTVYSDMAERTVEKVQYVVSEIARPRELCA